MPRALLAGTCRRYDAVVFRISAASNAEWNSQVDKVGAWTPHNYSAWAELKKLDGWTPLRVVDINQRPVTQVLSKTVGRALTIAYSPGGFLTDFGVDAGVFTTFLGDATKSKLLYCRVHMLTPTHLKRSPLNETGWQRVWRTMSSGESLELRLDTSLEDRVAILSYNWKRNLARGEKRENHVEVMQNPSADEIAKSHLELETIKGKHLSVWESSVPHARTIVSEFGRQLVIVRCSGPDGTIRSLRGAVITAGGASAFDFLATTTEDGRKHYSSYVTFWHLANELSRRGVTRYDLGGVDRIANKGVFDFKNGTGATPISYGGEFDATIPKLLRTPVSRLVSRVA
jgi:lipid II:glycine glycyltransferase (peptidoglycan interpeptide bridge formation enzyme)